MTNIKTIITGTGCYIPSVVIKNSQFTRHSFFEKDESFIESPGEMVVSKFHDITGISERRWLQADLTCSDIAALAAEAAIADAGIDRETIDQIIVAHNFADVIAGTVQSDMVPSLASRVKHMLKIANPYCIPYDIIFGCPGWIQGIIHSDTFIRSGAAKRCLVIGAETLSRVSDKYDRDTMIFSDGAGAVIVEAGNADENRGILSTAAVSHTNEEAGYLYMGKSNSPNGDTKVRYIKMHGRKVYEYSLMNVPVAMKTALDRSGIPITEVKKVLLHQANEKMDEAIVKRFFRLYGINVEIDKVMPMNIRELGNSSVATIPTLYDMILKGEVKGHSINKNDILLFASVGAGMNINAFVYRY
ncbi:MAG TPA: 3-oxoacyl-ACP synthase III family protein [Bacteroidales bacterium]|nr:3-oxoacyl-ACP synthase III family protein [Bacteroidales bacterium]